MTKEIRLEIKSRNNLVLMKMEEKGIRTVTELGRRANLPNHIKQRIADIINFKVSPLKPVGNGLKAWKNGVIEISEVLECTPEELFPDNLKNVRISRDVKVFTEVSLQDFKRLGGLLPKQLVANTDPEKSLMVNKFEDLLDRSLKMLSPREEMVLKLRFGLEDGEEHGFEEIAEKFGISRERVRQIESKALRKMRHPARSRTLGKMARDIGVLGR